MARCENCYRSFDGDIFLSICPDCRRLQGVERDRARREEEREQQDQERRDAGERRYREDREREDERRSDEQWRAFQAEDRQREREVQEESRREEFLERQREQLAHAWRYEAESKLTAAKNLYALGSRGPALDLARQASVLGIDAQQLIGWIERDDGDLRRYAESLRLQIGQLAAAGTDHHQARVLKEILDQNSAREGLLDQYFQAALSWRDFPYSIQPDIEALGLAVFPPLRNLVSSHIRTVPGTTPEALNSRYGRQFVDLLLRLPGYDAHLCEISVASRGWQFFPAKVIDALLEKGLDKTANIVFSTTLDKHEKSGVSLLWDVAPYGMELAARGLQPRVLQGTSWAACFEKFAEQLSLEAIEGGAYRELLGRASLGDSTKAEFRRVIEARAAAMFAEENRAFVVKQKKDRNLQVDLPAYQSAEIFAALFMFASAFFMWMSGSPVWLAILLAMPIGIVAYVIKSKFNQRLCVDVVTVKWVRKRRAALARSLVLADDRIDKALGHERSVNTTTPLVVPGIVVGLLIALSGGAVYYSYVSDMRARGFNVSGDAWSRDWDVYYSPKGKRFIARLGLTSSSEPLLQVYMWSKTGGALGEILGVMRLRQCVAIGQRAACEGNTTVRAGKESTFRSNLELDISKGTGLLTWYLSDERQMVFNLSRTPTSLRNAPKWIEVRR